MTNLYTIGFSKKTLQDFIGLLDNNGIKKVIDTRLNNTSQLSGFSKRDDLKFILELFNIEYDHMTILAPTAEILKSYKNKEIQWPEYEIKYKKLLVERNVAQYLSDIYTNEPVCLLCSEHLPDKCHRKILAEYLIDSGSQKKIVHLT